MNLLAIAGPCRVTDLHARLLQQEEREKKKRDKAECDKAQAASSSSTTRPTRMGERDYSLTSHDMFRMSQATAALAEGTSLPGQQGARH